MSTSSKTIAAALVLLSAVLFGASLYAATMTPQIGGGISQFDGGISSQGSQAPQPTGDILLVDGASFILQTDGASLICRAGGC